MDRDELRANWHEGKRWEPFMEADERARVTRRRSRAVSKTLDRVDDDAPQKASGLPVGGGNPVCELLLGQARIDHRSGTFELRGKPTKDRRLQLVRILRKIECSETRGGVEENNVAHGAGLHRQHCPGDPGIVVGVCPQQ